MKKIYLILVTVVCMCAGAILLSNYQLKSIENKLLLANVEVLSQEEDTNKKYVLVKTDTRCSYTISGVTYSGYQYSCKEDPNGNSTCLSGCGN